jgi:tetratricopeptide (TPR) repeat protein
LQILRSLVGHDKSNTGWQRDLAWGYEKFGVVLEAEGKLQEALDAYRQGIDTAKQLAEQDESNSDWQRDLLSYERFGDALDGQGKPSDALDAYQKSLSIRKTLAEKDQPNIARQSELAVAYNKVGEVLEAQKKSSPKPWMYTDNVLTDATCE